MLLLSVRSAIIFFFIYSVSTFLIYFSSICFQVEILSDDDDDDDDDEILPVNSSEDRYRPQALDKMISLIAMLVEKSRGDDKQLHLIHRDMMAIIGGKVK